MPKGFKRIRKTLFVTSDRELVDEMKKILEEIVPQGYKVTFPKGADTKHAIQACRELGIDYELSRDEPPEWIKQAIRNK